MTQHSRGNEAAPILSYSDEPPGRRIVIQTSPDETVIEIRGLKLPGRWLVAALVAFHRPFGWFCEVFVFHTRPPTLRGFGLNIVSGVITAIAVVAGYYLVGKVLGLRHARIRVTRDVVTFGVAWRQIRTQQTWPRARIAEVHYDGHRTILLRDDKGSRVGVIYQLDRDETEWLSIKLRDLLNVGAAVERR